MRGHRECWSFLWRQTARRWNQAQIGKEFKISRERVRQIIGSVNKKEIIFLSIEQHREQMVALRLEGKSLSEISLKTGIPLYWIKRAELPERPDKPIIHGTRTTYTHYGCRCSECRKANTSVGFNRIQRLRSEGKCINCGVLSEKFQCPKCLERFQPRKGPKLGCSKEPGIVWNAKERQWKVVIKGVYYGQRKTLEDAKKLKAESVQP